MVTPETKGRRYLYDFEVCYGHGGLANTLRYINESGCEVLSVTQTGTEYTVVFRRPM